VTDLKINARHSGSRTVMLVGTTGPDLKPSHRESRMTLTLRRTSLLALAASLGLGISAPAFAQSSLAPVIPKAATEGVQLKDEPSMPSRLAAKSLLLDATFAGDRIVAVGEWGHIVYSDDQGANWTQAQVPVDVTLTAVTFIDAKTGWAVGHDSVILNTTDGGQTWAVQNKQPELEQPLFSVYFKDAQNGFAVGAYSLFLATNDGGKTWTKKTIGDSDFHMNGIFKAKDGTLFIAGEAGHVFRSKDGESWDILQTPYQGSFWNGLGVDDGGVLVFGMRGNIWRSDDDGENWKQIDNPSTSSIQAGRILSDGRVVLVGLEGTVQISKDGGKTFTYAPRDDREAMAALIQTKDGVVHVFGEEGAKTQPLTQ
jgi:photosystem II stability/assembly factor-like uncharacterized protein